MCIAAAIAGSAVVGGVVSSSASKKAAKSQAKAAGKAAEAQTDSAKYAADQTLTGQRESNALLDKQFQQTRADFQPYRDAGQAALTQQTAGVVPGGDFNRDFTMADFTADPGYQFRMNAGREAIEGGAAARGGLLSGGTLKALTRYGQDYGSGEYTSAYTRFNADRDRRFNRLSAIAGTGQTATTQTAAAGESNANAQSNNISNSAATRANLTVGAGNATANGYLGAGNAAAASTIGQANAWTGALNSGVNGYMSMQMLNSLNRPAVVAT